MFYLITLVLGAVVALIFCCKRAKGFGVGTLMWKIASSLCFLLTGVAALVTHPENTTYGALLLFGGALGMCGDITLDLKGIYEQDKKPFMYSGFIFFLIGHLFYQAAILLKANLSIVTILICVGVCLVFGILNLLGEKLMKLHFGEYKLIVFLYSVILALTVAFAVAAMFASGFERAYIVFVVGGVLFMLSDLILSGTYFGEGKDRPVDYFTNHFAYYASQFVIMSTIMFVK
ncbi:MAG: hypothetical protein IJJ41_05965 [Clostridia bacterium]|nr:hypothetical protein [Clostridia bacterium]